MGRSGPSHREAQSRVTNDEQSQHQLVCFSSGDRVDTEHKAYQLPG